MSKISIIECDGGGIVLAENSWAKLTYSQKGYGYAVEKAGTTQGFGREVLKILCAAYRSAGEGRKIEFPYTPPPGVKKPIDLWKKP